MGFLYPLFLAAGVALAIPFIIHLFNLRRYKTVYFPHTRFLKDIQLRSQKSSQLRYKWLLALRLLFLASLILAFAQPFFTATQTATTERNLQAIYIDNSGSMSLKKGARSLLDVAKATARKQVQKSVVGTKFVLLTNDKPVSYRPMSADKFLLALDNISISGNSKPFSQTLSYLQSIRESENFDGADLYCYSDFQQSSFANPPDQPLLKNIRISAIPINADEAANIYIDTAYLTQPILQIGESNQIVIKTKAAGELAEKSPVLNLRVNNQIKAASTLNFTENSERTDTLNFRVADANWQKIELTIDDATTKFDDTFRITARSSPNLSVLCLNERSPSPYIQAAFRAYNGFRLQNANINTPPENWSEFSLIILNGCSSISQGLGTQLCNAIKNGHAVCIFPAKTNNLNGINIGLQQIANISLNSFDTSAETATSIQRGNELIKDLFEDIPENVQLPATNWHYSIQADLSANQQSIINYRNGDPMFAQYNLNGGSLFLSTTGIGLQDGNFPSSYFFAPFLYQMAVQSTGGNVYALRLGAGVPAYMPLADANSRTVVHLTSGQQDAIPPQRTQGAGLNVFVDEVVNQAGFYNLVAENAGTTIVAVNTNSQESRLTQIDVSNLKNLWQTDEIQVLNTDNIGITGNYNRWGSFPLWKVCVIFALIMLAAETWVLANSLRKPTAATE